jgi:hypothetical protein
MGDSVFIQNAGIYLDVHAALPPRRPTSTYTYLSGGEYEEVDRKKHACAIIK